MLSGHIVYRCSPFQEDETKPEDCIPDVPGNEHAREFLAHAPTRGLWMPLGKEVKVMQCECKRVRCSERTRVHTALTGVLLPSNVSSSALAGSRRDLCPVDGSHGQ